MPNAALETQTEDLRAFERRLIDIQSHFNRTAGYWRLVFTLVSCLMAFFAYFFITDSNLTEYGFFSTLFSHRVLLLMAISFVTMLALGAHKKMFAPQVVAGRSRQALADFSMSCDDEGRLLLHPRM